MDCLKGFFSLSKGCSTVAPTSGLYVDMLEGVSLKSLSNIVGADKLTAQHLVDEKTVLVGELLKAGPNRFLLEDAVEHSVDSMICKDWGTTYVEGSTDERGLRIEKKRARLTSLLIERIYFKSHTTVEDLEITISDGVKEEVFTINAEADEEIVIEANFSTRNTSVDIVYTSEDVEPYAGSICPYNNFVESDCHGCTGSKSLKIRTIEAAEKLVQYRGIKVDASVICDREKMVCLIAEHQKMAFLYLVGSEIMKEWASTDRLNFLAVSSKEYAQNKAVEWEAKANQIFYDNAQGIKKYLEGHQRECFICNQAHYGFTLP